jgi:VIT1/CCC1 family predicted Fe2+/Mn2+ transporter
MKINHSIRVGLSFGITSGIITTLGMMVGLSSGTNSQLVVIGGILTIAIADSFSDALGIHMSEESEGKHTSREIWQSTIATFLSKLLFALTFLIPIFIFSLDVAVLVSVAWGLTALSVLTYVNSVRQKENPWHALFEHLLTAILVIVSTHYVGEFISTIFV